MIIIILLAFFVFFFFWEIVILLALGKSRRKRFSMILDFLWWDKVDYDIDVAMCGIVRAKVVLNNDMSFGICS